MQSPSTLSKKNNPPGTSPNYNTRMRLSLVQTVLVHPHINTAQSQTESLPNFLADLQDDLPQISPECQDNAD